MTNIRICVWGHPELVSGSAGGMQERICELLLKRFVISSEVENV
jgi:hypothetical protein